MLILGEGATQSFDHETLTTEDKYPINFTQLKKNMDCYGSNSLLFLNPTKMFNFKTKDSETKDYTLCLGII